jgi:hypothetical protein
LKLFGPNGDFRTLFSPLQQSTLELLTSST